MYPHGSKPPANRVQRWNRYSCNIETPVYSKVTTTVVRKCCRKSLVHLKGTLKSIVWSRRSIDQEMFYLQLPVFIIYLYYLALLSALQTQQKHSQQCYADSAPFVEIQTGVNYKRCTWVFSTVWEPHLEEISETI